MDRDDRERLKGLLEQAELGLRTKIRNEVPVEVARAVLWHFGDRELGQEPGEFVKRLLDLLMVADLDNQARLTRAGFHWYAFTVYNAQNHGDGMDWLRAKVRDWEAVEAIRFGMPGPEATS